MMSKLLSRAWWHAAGVRALRTALVIAVPYVSVTYFAEIPFATIASAAGLGIILSLVTSLVGLAEVEGEIETWYYAILSRVVKTVGQAVIAGIGTSVLITEVDWPMVLQSSLAAGFGSLLLAVLGTLPEAPKPSAGITS